MSIQFNDTTNKSGLIQRCEMGLFGGNFGDISGDTDLLAAFTVYINEGVSDYNNTVVDSDTRWEFHDSNLTTLPNAYTTLVDSQQDYKLPDVVMRIRALYVKDNNGTEHPLVAISETDLQRNGQAPKAFLTTDGLPKYYDKVGSYVLLYPSPAAASVTLSQGLRVSYSSTPDYFTSADTTQTLGAPATFHHYPAVYAMWKYAVDNSMENKAVHFKGQLDELRYEVQNFYSKRDADSGINGLRANRRSYV